MKLAEGLEAQGFLDNSDVHDGQMVLAVGDGAGLTSEEDATGRPGLPVTLHTGVVWAHQLLGLLHLLYTMMMMMMEGKESLFER